MATEMKEKALSGSRGMAVISRTFEVERTNSGGLEISSIYARGEWSRVKWSVWKNNEKLGWLVVGQEGELIRVRTFQRLD